MMKALARHRDDAQDATDRVRLHRWLAHAPGSAVAAAEVQLLDALLPNLFGYHLLQVGRLGGFDLLGSSRILGRSIVDIDGCSLADRGSETGSAPSSSSSEAGATGPSPIDANAAADVVTLHHGSSGAGHGPPSEDAKYQGEQSAGHMGARYTGAAHRGAEDQPGGRYPCVRGEPNALPFDADSVDVVLLPHTLEFVAQPHEALREAMRVLVAEGHLVLCGFNPWSLLGVCARTNAGIVPWRANLLGASRVKDWLKLLGLELLEVRSCFFRPPIRNPKLMARLDFIERCGESAGARRLTAGLSAAAGVYVMVARKRVTTLTPLRARWRPRARLAGVGLAGPSAHRRDAA